MPLQIVILLSIPKLSVSGERGWEGVQTCAVMSAHIPLVGLPSWLSSSSSSSSVFTLRGRVQTETLKQSE